MSAAERTLLPSVAILGAGSMGRAILAGMLSPAVEVDGGIVVTNRSAAKAAEFDDEPRVEAIATDDDPEGNRRAAAGAAIVLVAVKPAMVPALLDEIADALRPGAVVVSVAAGVTVATFEKHLPAHVAVLRSMPNTPAVVGRAVTGLSAGTRSSDADLELVRSLFETVGTVVEVPESQLDALSTISGSGPAYVYLLIEALTAAAVEKGFTPDQAAILVNETFAGATELLTASGATPTALRIQVTSPKGTTERALAVLDDADLPALFTRATDAALARAKELAASA
ncbi:pyrroline-5-carboxylate reductase [Herbiconiux moechotypicola]|uniref:Pyrroline-5-carboxylate reductase n=1 Tax=Herbiconiux moechotypicola TaxID=637393 RepID=A0ABP5R002_9MICO|nr:pyrroline-5-carboxylate reductase [Herbiconiux moechotypicola]MCS5731148.1 pyrroline-5-carboxylate reductase [Herbiconiux moechotypicola]